MRATIVLTGHLYIDFDKALDEVKKQLSHRQGAGTLLNGLVSYKFRVEGEELVIALYLEAALDQNTPDCWTTQQRQLAFLQWQAAQPQYAGRFDPVAAAALAAWLKNREV